uniref:Uncharacterized protein n=1 Tax=Romanomermis culicivorax TaxID=13658 RepID=A0A915J4X7_ROMCU
MVVATAVSASSAGGIGIDNADVEQIDAEVVAPIAVFRENRWSRQVVKKADPLVEPRKRQTTYIHHLYDEKLDIYK